MANTYFQFKQFIIRQDQCSMKVTTDACLFGAWVSSCLENINSVKTILDIGSGTGLLSLMLAQKIKSEITGIELQLVDYEQSVQNINGSAWNDRVHIFNADVKTFNFCNKYDAIICNPPFYENDLKGPSAGKNTAHHDNSLTINELLQIIYRQLNPDGRFYILLPSKREKYLIGLIESHALFINQIVRVKQTEKHAFFRIMIEGSYEKSETMEKVITIKENSQYSAIFTALLKDYYLNL